MKRFWQQAGARFEDGAWRIFLDQRPMRMPGGPSLALRHQPLAEAIAAEWQMAGGEIGGELSLDAIPLTRLAATAALFAAHPAERARVGSDIAAYGESDLLCYRASAPGALAERQARLWQPWLDWAETSLGARLESVCGLAHRRQDELALARLRNLVAASDDETLAGLALMVPALGSLILGLAVAHGALTPEAAADLSELDALFQAESWGEDAEALARRERLTRDIVNGARLIRLTRSH